MPSKSSPSLGYSGPCSPFGEGEMGMKETPNRRLQNTPLRHLDYFELMALEKQEVRTGSLPSTFLPKAGHNISPENTALPGPETEEHSHPWKMAVKVEMDLHQQTS